MPRATWRFSVLLLSLVGGLLILLFAMGMLAQRINLVGGLVVTELCLLAVALLPVRWWTPRVGEELGLKLDRGLPGLAADLGVGMVWGLLSLMAGMPVAVLWRLLLPPPPGYYEALGEALTPDTPVELGIWLTLMVMVGFCEEVFGRGVIQQGAENQLGRYSGLICASAIFAGLHLDPYRFGPLFVISLLWGWRFQRSRYSLYSTWAAHTTNNAVAILILYLAALVTATQP